MATQSSEAKAVGDEEVARLKARVQALEAERAQHHEAASATTPIVIDLGKARRKRIKALKRGKGKLMDEVYDVMSLAREDLGEEVAGKVLVPVVVIYRQRRRKRKRNRLMFPF